MIKSRKWRLRGIRTFALVGLGLGLGFAPIVRADPGKGEEAKPKQVVPTGKEDAAPPTAAQLAAEQEIERMTDRSTEGLVPVQHANGMVSVDLEGRFMHVMRAVPDGRAGRAWSVPATIPSRRRSPAGLQGSARHWRRNRPCAHRSVPSPSRQR